MESNTIEKKIKNIGIVYCRLSRMPSEKFGVMSLDSQEHAIQHFMKARGIGTYAVLKNIGSAFNKPQTELKTFLRGCKNKILIVYEPNRLSRNTQNFAEIWKICKKNNHTFAIVTMDMFFPSCISSNYEILMKLIQQAQQESSDMGRRISRTYRYKKSREPAWGYRRNDKDDKILEDEKEQMTTKLVKLLSTPGSLTEEIRQCISLVGKYEGKEPFSLVEITGRSSTRDMYVDRIPYSMSPKNIVDTFKYYEIRMRRKRFTVQDINKLKSIPSSTIATRATTPDVTEKDIDNMCDDFEVVQVEKKTGQEWLTIWYDPAIGLPPNVRIPEGMTLPVTACQIMIPKL